MAGRIVLASHRPRSGGGATLLERVRPQVPRFRELGLATDRRTELRRAEGATLAEILERAAERARGLPALREVRDARVAFAELVPPSGSAGLDRPFPQLDPVDGILE